MANCVVKIVSKLADVHRVMYMHVRWPLFGRRPRPEAGAALVESALAMLLAITVIAGILDYASLFGNTIDVSSAARLAARTGASTAISVVPDYKIVEAVVKKPGTERQGIKRIVIYKAEADSTGPPAACKSATQSIPADKCNVYLPADFALGASLPEKDGWPLATRVPGDDYLGVWVEVERVPLFRGVLWSPSHYADYTVMRLEPNTTPTSPTNTGFSTGTNADPGLSGDWCLAGACANTGISLGGSGSGGSS